jgi:hypothetical protein
MTAENFTYWLQGYLEVSGAKELNEEQLKVIQDHLKLVLTKVTTTYGGNNQLGQQTLQSLPYQGFPQTLITC